MSDLPLRIGLLLDVSDSMKRAMEQEKSVALAFLKRVVRPGTDRAFVMAFGDTVQIFQDPTSDVADLDRSGEAAKGPGESTDLFDAVYSACVDQWKTSGDQTRAPRDGRHLRRRRHRQPPRAG